MKNKYDMALHLIGCHLDNNLKEFVIPAKAGIGLIGTGGAGQNNKAFSKRKGREIVGPIPAFAGMTMWKRCRRKNKPFGFVFALVLAISVCCGTHAATVCAVDALAGWPKTGSTGFSTPSENASCSNSSNSVTNCYKTGIVGHWNMTHAGSGVWVGGIAICLSMSNGEVSQFMLNGGECVNACQ